MRTPHHFVRKSGWVCSTAGVNTEKTDKCDPCLCTNPGESLDQPTALSKKRNTAINVEHPLMTGRTYQLSMKNCHLRYARTMVLTAYLPYAIKKLEYGENAKF